MKTQKQAGLFSAPTPKSPLSSFSQASKTMTNDILAKYSAPLPKNALQSAVNFGIISTQSQKTIAEPQNSNDLYLANSTPQACFFIRSTRTPKERLERLSMVACNGKGSTFAVFQVSQFLSPLHVTAQTLRSLAVAFINHTWSYQQ